MGLAKYFEDIMEDNLAYQEYFYGYRSNVTSHYSCYDYTPDLTTSVPKIPLVKKQINESFEIYVNNKKLSEKETTYSDIYSLTLRIPKTINKIEFIDDIGNTFVFCENNGFYNLSSKVLNAPFSRLQIQADNSKDLFVLRQTQNIQRLTNADIYNKRYKSEIFDNFVSNDSLDEQGYLIYLKLLVTEGENPDAIVDRACMTNFYKKLTPEFFWTYFLATEFASDDYLIKSRLDERTIHCFISILNGEYEKAASLLKEDKTKSQEILGCKLLLGLLNNDELLIEYLKEKYKPVGYIGALVSLIIAYQKNNLSNTKNNLYTLSLIKQYPLVKAIFALYGFEGEKLSQELYSLVEKVDYKVPAMYYNQVTDVTLQEKILKSALEVFDNSEELKNLSYSNNFSWVRKYISYESPLYMQELNNVNNARQKPYKTSFLNSIKIDEDIEITNLGKGKSISANCILVSYKGYNILLDVGLDPRMPEQTAYPFIDGVEKNIDYIVVTHAHIDHCGGLPKAHSMWQNAKIIATAPTKRLMRYLFNDAAKIKNDKYSEFEITNVTLEKDVIRDTIFHTIETEYEQWISISENIKFRLHNAGHMIGAAMVELRINNKTILYTGDFTDYNQSLSTGIDFSKIPKDIDLLISEATYVEKPNFEWINCCSDLKQQILLELRNNRTVLIPSAAIGRAQELVCMLGEMAINGELPKKTKLYLGGLAIPMSTQISPYFNEKYDLILEQFNELGVYDIPEQNSIIIASSNYLSKGSASYRVLSNMSMNNSITIFTNTKVSKDAEILIYKSPDVLLKNYSLPTHADVKGIKKLIDWTKPNFVSFIHSGGNTEYLEHEIMNSFNNDICIYESKENKQIRVFDLLNLMEEGLV